MALLTILYRKSRCRYSSLRYVVYDFAAPGGLPKAGGVEGNTARVPPMYAYLGAEPTHLQKKKHFYLILTVTISCTDAAPNIIEQRPQCPGVLLVPSPKTCLTLD